MATKWNDLKHKATSEKRDRLKQEALAELDTIKRSGMGILQTTLHVSAKLMRRPGAYLHHLRVRERED